MIPITNAKIDEYYLNVRHSSKNRNFENRQVIFHNLKGVFSFKIISLTETNFRCLNGVKCVQLPSEEAKSATVCGTAEVEEDPVLAFCVDDSAQKPGGVPNLRYPVNYNPKN